MKRKTNKKDVIDFFGNGTYSNIPVKRKAPSNPFSLYTKSPPLYKKTQPVAFLSNKKVPLQNMNHLRRMGDGRYVFPSLSKVKRYGDDDLDGSPNRWDCKPKRVEQDGIVSDMLRGIKSTVQRKLPMVYPKKKQMLEKETRIQDRMAKRQELLTAEKRLQETDIKLEKEKDEKKREQLQRQKEREEISVMKKESGVTKELLKQENERIRKAKERKQADIKFGKSVVHGTRKFAEVALPTEVLRGAKTSGGGRGRPTGTLNPKYAQYGGVYQYRAAMSKATSLARASGVPYEIIKSAKDRGASPAEISGLAGRIRQGPMQQPSTQSYSTQSAPRQYTQPNAEPQMRQTTEVLDNETVQIEQEVPTQQPIPSQASSMARQRMINEQMQKLQRQMEYEQMSPQKQAMAADNILKAPQFMKGELKATGGSIMNTSPRDNILNAPRIDQGEMRTMNTGEVPAVTLSERPQTNPYGGEYTQIDPMSGKPIYSRRISEAWLDGRSL